MIRRQTPITAISSPASGNLLPYARRMYMVSKYAGTSTRPDRKKFMYMLPARELVLNERP